MIALARHMSAYDPNSRLGAFRGWRPLLYGGSINRARVCVIGAGWVGQALLKVLSEFDCERIYHDTQSMHPELARALDAVPSSLETLTETSDFVVLATPPTPEILGMVDAAFLARMKRGRLLVSPGRGSVVVEPDVADALASGPLGGYAADVFEMEGRSRLDAPTEIPGALRFALKTVFTPHRGSAVVSARRQIGQAAAAAIVRALCSDRDSDRATASWH